jgi:hypothetical protein
MLPELPARAFRLILGLRPAVVTSRKRLVGRRRAELTSVTTSEGAGLFCTFHVIFRIKTVMQAILQQTDYKGKKFGIRVKPETVQVIFKDGDSWKLDGDGHTTTYPSLEQIDLFVARPRDHFTPWDMAWCDLRENNPSGYKELRAFLVPRSR